MARNQLCLLDICEGGYLATYLQFSLPSINTKRSVSSVTEHRITTAPAVPERVTATVAPFGTMIFLENGVRLFGKVSDPTPPAAKGSVYETCSPPTPPTLRVTVIGGVLDRDAAGSAGLPLEQPASSSAAAPVTMYAFMRRQSDTDPGLLRILLLAAASSTPAVSNSLFGQRARRPQPDSRAFTNLRRALWSRPLQRPARRQRDRHPHAIDQCPHQPGPSVASATRLARSREMQARRQSSNKACGWPRVTERPPAAGHPSFSHQVPATPHQRRHRLINCYRARQLHSGRA